MFDGKKVKRGTDVDLLGFEKGMTLSQRQQKRDNDIAIIDALKDCIEKVKETTNQVSDTPVDM